MTVGVFREFFYNDRLDFKNLNNDTVVIFDTNTLLNIYRYSNDTRNQLISAIKSIQSNVWMPYQVGLEFNLNRRSVISTLNREKEKRKSEIGDAINESVDPLKQSVRAVSLKSTDVNSRKNEIIKFLEEKTTELKNDLQKKIDELYEMVDLSEDLASEITIIFDGHIGECYTQNQLDTKLLDAKERYDNKIPPGYKDANKGDEVTNYNGVKFEKKYGDLIVWHQILDKASDESIKKVVLVTDDNKEDWWYKSFGETIGPRAELKNEMLRIANADLYMLNANSFLNNFALNEGVKDLISTETDVELKEYKPGQRWTDTFMLEDSKVWQPFNNTKKEFDTFGLPKGGKSYQLGYISGQIKALEIKAKYTLEKIEELSNSYNSIDDDDDPKKKEIGERLVHAYGDSIQIRLDLDRLQAERSKLSSDLNRLKEYEKNSIINPSQS
ncbi:PIN-like domain-containing protein [Lysinibacillus fusiformis]|uniref:PIN-like domain-containing protein n=1 Tax=Lysinibacillus fusiformis TaxID=28031 RepID=UPI003CF44F5C